MITWDDIAREARAIAATKGRQYVDHLEFEIAEIDKQATNIYWVNTVAAKKTFNHNKNSLVLPFLLGLTEIDPVGHDGAFLSTKYDDVTQYTREHGKLPTGIFRDSDMPDIDVDCLPMAREEIKNHAMERFGTDTGDGYGSVCSVGAWQTYLFRSALADVARATEICTPQEVQVMTKTLPDEVDDMKEGGFSKCKGRIINGQTGEEDECGFTHKEALCPKCGSNETDNPTIGKLLAEYPELGAFAQRYPDVVDYGARLIGRIKTIGMHAAAIIITDRPLYGNIPLAKTSTSTHWVSLWTEGRSTQLSKFGYTKWDILGLNNLQYIFTCCQLIEKGRGISFGQNMCGWDDVDPTQDKAGYYIQDGVQHKILLNDPAALKLANERRTDAVFQFDTPLAKQILSNGVRNFKDLMLFNAMGHPGPMKSIPDAVANRDDKHQVWKQRMPPEIAAILEDTYGVICYQEQLQAIWQLVAGFTAPEAQEARKAVAKKWRHLLKPIEGKWLAGAGPKIGQKEAEEWWAKMVDFGRYAFNRSHSVAYCLVAYRCLWLKAHFAPEWWASVMTYCHQDKRLRYMNVARAENVKFDTLDANNLTVEFTVTNGVVNPGLICLKKVGDNKAVKYVNQIKFTDIDSFVAKYGKDKVVFERLVKLGAFKKYPGHENSKALWLWYQYAYCNETKLRTDTNEKILALLWPGDTAEKERQRQIAEYKHIYPNRKVIPPKLLNWKPKIQGISHSLREMVMGLEPEDYTKEEILKFENEYLGYYIHSPLDIYKRCGHSIRAAKTAFRRMSSNERKDGVLLEAIITEVSHGTTKNDTPMARLLVSDGLTETTIYLWEHALRSLPRDMLKPKLAFLTRVVYDENRDSFTLSRTATIRELDRM